MSKQLYVLTAFLMLCVCGVARADILYTYTGAGSYAGSSYSLELSTFATQGTKYSGGNGELFIDGNDRGAVYGINFQGGNLGLIYFYQQSGINGQLIPGDFTKIGTFSASDGTVSVSQVASSAPTPEPSSLALLGTGLIGLVGAVRRRLA